MRDLVPHYIKVFCRNLLLHNEPKFVDESEVRFIASDTETAHEFLGKSKVYSSDTLPDKQITLMNTHRMTSQVTIREFPDYYKNKESETEDRIAADVPDSELSRLMECISVKDGEDIHLLCDDPRSLMRTMYNSTLVILRRYEFPANTEV